MLAAVLLLASWPANIVVPEPPPAPVMDEIEPGGTSGDDLLHQSKRVLIEAIDSDKDRKLTRAELKEYMVSDPQASIAALRSTFLSKQESSPQALLQGPGRKRCRAVQAEYTNKRDRALRSKRRWVRRPGRDQ